MIDRIINAVRDDLFEELTSIIPQEIIVKEVSKNGGIVAKHTSAPSEILDTELGSITGGQFGFFTKPEPGSKALAIRVYPGSTNHTQIISSIFNPAKQKHDGISEPVADTDQGVMADGNYEIKPGDLLLRSKLNQTLLLKSHGDGHNGSINLLDNNGAGITIETINSSTFLSSVSHYIQNISAAVRSFSGEYHQSIKESDFIKSSSNMYGVIRPTITTDNKIGLFYQEKAYDAKILNNPRNIPLSFYKKTINQVTEKAKFIGFENERQMLNLGKDPESAYDEVELSRFYQSRNLYNLFFMAPDQLIQVISGNLLSLENNYSPININYGTTSFDDFKNVRDVFQVQEESNSSFVKIKNNFKRGIGYHFQLNTHNNIKDDFLSTNNTRVILDKEGILKVNIPKSSKHGNVMYVDSTSFIKDGEKEPKIINNFANPSSEENIPITLRGNSGEVLLPPRTLQNEVRNSGKVRYTGIEFSNANGYFGKPETIGLKVRVNTTKYHNMYAACEMLLANHIAGVAPPTKTDPNFHGTAKQGMSISETFEKYDSRYAGKISNASIKEYNKNSSYGAALVIPQKPIINPGRSLVFGGKSYDDLPVYINNDLEQEETDKQKFYEGVSANINLEGSLEASIGADSADKKSITLDTEGGAVMWFGKDANNRSLSVQTDGDALFNIGGRTGKGPFNEGRFDLRVNFTDKGVVATDAAEDITKTDSDFILSISSNGIVISGMKKDTPMIINNTAMITIQSPNGILLNGGMGGVQILDKNRSVRDAGLPQSNTANSGETGDIGGPDSVERLFDEAEDFGSKV